MWRQYPHLPPGIPIHITGNPRVDLLRTDMQGYYRAEANQIRKICGEVILINTNFKSLDFEEHRYPGITPGELAERIARFQQLLGDDTQLQLRQIHDKVFSISA